MEDNLTTTDGGLIHPCYVLMQRLHTCIRRENFYTRMCMDEFEDFQECQKGRKVQLFQVVMNEQTRKTTILKVPRYDQATDTFFDLPADFDVERHFKKEKVSNDMK